MAHREYHIFFFQSRCIAASLLLHSKKHERIDRMTDATTTTETTTATTEELHSTTEVTDEVKGEEKGSETEADSEGIDPVKEARKWERRAKKSLKDAEEAQSKAEAAEARAKEAETKLAELEKAKERRAMVSKAAAEKQIPEDILDRMTGDDEETIWDNADFIAASLSKLSGYRPITDPGEVTTPTTTREAIRSIKDKRERMRQIAEHPDLF